jgi:hypothetical protein
LREKVFARLNNYLCDMKPDYDDSITGFNEAWDVVRKAFDDFTPTHQPAAPADTEKE